jgi:uncharacterized membrane protein
METSIESREVNVLSMVEKSFDVEAAADKVWQLITWDRMPQWFNMFKSAEWTSTEKNKVGSKIHVRSEVAEVKNDFEAEITEFADAGEGTRAWKTTGGNFTAAGAVYVKPDGNKSRVMMVEEYKLPYGPIGTMLDKIRFRKAFENSFSNSCTRLKEISENRDS